MTLKKGAALVFVLAAAGAIVQAGATGSSTVPAAKLKTISSRVDGKGTSVVIEATEPVPYMTTRPDALTVVLEFRNVDAQSVTKKIATAGKSAVADVTVENGDALGAPSSRVRIALSEAVAHRVRSEKNQVIVEFDKADGRSAPYVMPPAGRDSAVVTPFDPSGVPARLDPIAALQLQGFASFADDPAPQSAPAAPGAQASAPAAPPATGQSTAPVVPIRPVFAAQPAASAAQIAAAQPAPAASQIAAAQPTAGPAPGPAPAPQNPAAPQSPPAAQNPPATAQPGTGQTLGGTDRRYTGSPVSFDFQDADLKSVLNVFAQEEGLNLLIDPGVQGTVNVHFTAVPWDQALDQILRANKLGYLVDGTIVRIAPIATLATEAEDRRKLADAQANEGELITMPRTLSYAKAEDMMPLLLKSNTLSPRGTVQVDARTNTLIITDLQPRLNAATDLIGVLDKPQPQVEIEARIVQTNKTYEKRMGVQWGFAGRADAALGNTTNLAFPNSVNLAGAAGGAVNGVPNAVNLAPTGATSGVSLALGSVNGSFNLDVALSALESSGNGRILSTPRVTTQNNIEAEMTQGTQIPIQTVSNNTVTVTFKDAALTLKVTPQITAAGTVIMAVALENSQADFSRSVNGIPPINTQRALTRLLVNDGETTVIGGVYSNTQQNVRDTTPGLSRIPILSWLFKRDLVDDTNNELLIFITPHILKG